MHFKEDTQTVSRHMKTYSSSVITDANKTQAKTQRDSCGKRSIGIKQPESLNTYGKKHRDFSKY